MYLIRSIMNLIYGLIEKLTTPARPLHSEAKQAELDAKTRGLALYHFQSCPFCMMVRRHIQREGLTVESRDIHRHGQFRDELVQGGGKQQVPCLRIERDDGGVSWLYESMDIIAYLKQL